MATEVVKAPLPDHLLKALGISKIGARPPLTGAPGRTGADKKFKDVQGMAHDLTEALSTHFPNHPSLPQITQLLNQLLQTPMQMPTEGGPSQ